MSAVTISNVGHTKKLYFFFFISHETVIISTFTQCHRHNGRLFFYFKLRITFQTIDKAKRNWNGNERFNKPHEILYNFIFIIFYFILFLYKPKRIVIKTMATHKIFRSIILFHIHKRRVSSKFVYRSSL